MPNRGFVDVWDTCFLLVDPGDFQVIGEAHETREEALAAAAEDVAWLEKDRLENPDWHEKGPIRYLVMEVVGVASYAHGTLSYEPNTPTVPAAADAHVIDPVYREYLLNVRRFTSDEIDQQVEEIRAWRADHQANDGRAIRAYLVWLYIECRAEPEIAPR